ncbi:fluoride efflux transporter CrcB [Conexibacter sp. CPCC 206217]|uniref:fluoride efflux transporter CrcB n=1 Tax=Conexibacter sp. CPCC 206217 TaxID=3064574 RepID=UPI0027226380|nr:fluoride efflux transporter CrcB [Conexibacter sp. CPCC 206217]MDO8212034.1 fluoride efflux transporter CrcB [Conexibacter sp. CPCC 206217]
MSVAVWCAVGALGAFGALARFAVDSLVSTRIAGRLPWGTFVVNVGGALVLGLLVGAAVGGDAYVLAGTATIGSYTTFSTWMLETFLLAEDGQLRWAAANVLGSLAVGLAAAELGNAIGGLL